MPSGGIRLEKSIKEVVHFIQQRTHVIEHLNAIGVFVTIQIFSVFSASFVAILLPPLIHDVGVAKGTRSAYQLGWAIRVVPLGVVVLTFVASRHQCPRFMVIVGPEKRNAKIISTMQMMTIFLRVEDLLFDNTPTTPKKIKISPIIESGPMLSGLNVFVLVTLQLTDACADIEGSVLLIITSRSITLILALDVRLYLIPEHLHKEKLWVSDGTISVSPRDDFW